MTEGISISVGIKKAVGPGLDVRHRTIDRHPKGNRSEGC
jgi:hypothetical protein